MHLGVKGEVKNHILVVLKKYGPLRINLINLKLLRQG